jgi:hypothetical protein
MMDCRCCLPGGSWSTTGSFADVARHGSSLARSLQRDAEGPGARLPTDVHSTPLRSNPTNRDAQSLKKDKLVF